MPAVLCDTGPLYAAADDDDTYHAQALQELQKLQQEHRHTLLLFPTLFECYSLILRRSAHPLALRWLREVLAGTTQISPSTEDYRSATILVGRYPDQSITLFDALTATIAIRLKVPVWTYDHHFDVLRVPVWR